MKKNTLINHENVTFDTVRTAKFVNKKKSEKFHVYYQGYDKNWDEYLWADGEGNIYAEGTEIIIVD